MCLPSDALLQHLPSYFGFLLPWRGVSLHGCSSKANSFGELEIISIVGWLGIILVKGFSFVVPIIAANSLPWVG